MKKSLLFILGLIFTGFAVNVWATAKITRASNNKFNFVKMSALGYSTMFQYTDTGAIVYTGQGYRAGSQWGRMVMMSSLQDVPSNYVAPRSASLDYALVDMYKDTLGHANVDISDFMGTLGTSDDQYVSSQEVLDIPRGGKYAATIYSDTLGYEYRDTIDILDDPSLRINCFSVKVGKDMRDTETIDGFYREWKDHLWAVRSVSMDLWPAFIGGARKWLEDADSRICFDRFHVAGFFGKAVDQVRKRECRDLKAEGDESLKGTKYDWLRNGNNIDGRSRRRFTELTRQNLKTARAWAIKETASRLWDYTSETWAGKAWRSLFGWMWRSRLSPMVDLARSLKRHFYGIMNAIMLGIDNGMAESINSKIQKVKKMACGFRNAGRFRNAIMFHFGGLDLYPALPTR